MYAFSHISPELRVHVGAKALSRMGRELDRLGLQRVVLFSGRTLAQGSHLDQIRENLGERYAGTFSGVRPHTPVPVVETAAAELQKMNADAVIAVGGGSAIVTARAAAILVGEERDLATLATGVDEDGNVHSPRLTRPKLPQFIVPTTPTTAMVKAGTAVHDPAADRRLAMFDPKTRARTLFLDPDLIMSAPMALARDSALDTLSLAVEGLLSHTGDPMADALLIHAIRLLVSGLPQLKSNDSNDLRVELISAAIMCGRGTDQTGAGMATVLGHAIGAAHGLDNGPVKAAVLPHVLRFNASHAAPGGIDRIASALGVAAGDGAVDAVIDALTQLYDRLEIASRLGELGLTSEALPDIARRGMDDWFLRGNPRRIKSSDQLLEVLTAAL